MMDHFANNLSIYLHWPFCRSKCPYCDFFSQVKKNIDQDEIIKDYLRQLEQYAELLPHRKIVSVFFGGGTPSLISPQNIEHILQRIDKLWSLSKQTEISLEANPNTNTPTLFQDLKIAGINRLSLGVQSLDDNELKFLGRTHNSRQAITAIEEITKNFNNHSADLIYALPKQNEQNWTRQLAQITSFGLKHISLYQLTIEENTLFGRKGIKPMDDEKAVTMYQTTTEFLTQHQYQHYEVSNYALNGFQSVHNKSYWLGHDYIGIGQTAHGRLKNNGKFFAVTDPMQFEELSADERAEELILMGIRLKEGISKNAFQEICDLNFDQFINQQFKQEAINLKLLEETPHNLKPTEKGFLVLDYLITGLCS